MNDTQIKHMVDRFLGWRLPESFNPDGGISFKRTFNDHLPTPSKNDPSGTNLFDATQSDAMVRYMVDGLPDAAPSGWRDIATAPKGRSFWGWHETWFDPDVCRWDGYDFVSKSEREALASCGTWTGYRPSHWKERTDIPTPPLPSGPTPQEQESGE